MTQENDHNGSRYATVMVGSDEFEDVFSGPHTRIGNLDSLFDDSEQTLNFARCL